MSANSMVQIELDGKPYEGPRTYEEAVQILTQWVRGGVSFHRVDLIYCENGRYASFVLDI